MICGPCTYLQESEAGCLPTSSLDTRQLSLLSGINTPVQFSGNEPQTDGFQDCTCGKETSECSIHPSTPETWIAFMRASLAKTLALLESRQVYLREPDQVFTEKSCVLLASFDRDTCSWKTLQQSFLTDSEPFSQTWPRWGMTQGGSAYAHPMSERRITETDGFVWPTVTTQDNVQVRGMGATIGTSRGTTLGGAARYWPTPDTRGFVNEGSLSMLSKMCDTEAEYVAMGYRAAATKKAKYWPTPSAQDNRDRGNLSMPSIQRRQAIGKQLMLSMVVSPDSGQLNPDWVAWLMGFPIAWASLKATETHKSRCKPQQHGDCSEVSE